MLRKVLVGVITIITIASIITLCSIFNKNIWAWRQSIGLVENYIEEISGRF